MTLCAGRWALFLTQILGPVYLTIVSSSCALRAVRGKSSLAPRVGESPCAPFIPRLSNLTARLLGVYDKLKGVGAAPTAEDEQSALVEEARGLVLDICNDHVFAAEAVVKDPVLRASLAERIKAECQELVEYVVAAKRFNLEINARSKDRVISFGEKLSCQFMTVLLQDVVSSL